MNAISNSLSRLRCSARPKLVSTKAVLLLSAYSFRQLARSQCVYEERNVGFSVRSSNNRL